MRWVSILLCVCVVLTATNLPAAVFGTVRGLIHDPQHRPVQGAQVTIKAVGSDWSRTVTSNELGEFVAPDVPPGQYAVTVSVPGFAPQKKEATVLSGHPTDLHFALAVQAAAESVEVSGRAEEVKPESSSSVSVVSREQIANTPGADRTNSMAMITDFVPGAVMVHDQLHLRGGHQATWLLDGIPVPNTNIASNVGPQFDPKDIDELEVQRGGLSPEYGDRAYGVFNVVTRSGFERNNEAEVVLNYGNFNETNDQVSFGSHSQQFAYYGSVSGNRTDLGLQTPTPQAIHAAANGLSGFLSLIFNSTPSDQLRLIASARRDYYQVPNTPEQQLAGVRDSDHEQDRFVNFTWAHTTKSGVLFTLSPFFHFNRAHYIGGPNDFPVSPEDDRGSNYMGGVAAASVTRGKHNARLGLQGFAQRDNTLFGVVDHAADITLRQRSRVWGSLTAAFAEDQYKVNSWLTLNGGVRLTHFDGPLSENSADPRIGGTVRLPKLNWVLRGFYGRYYQAPPLQTVTGPLLELSAAQGFGFLPLRGERDEQHEFGLTVPLAGWSLDVDQFRTSAKNFFDHEVLGNSNIFFPVTIDRARIHGWEASVRSPKLPGDVRFHLAYSHQYVEGRGGISGGLSDFEPPESSAYYFLDHDQRDSLSTGFQVSLPWHAWASGNLAYGSGFLDGDGPNHLPGHTTFDLSVGKSLGERLTVQATALNLTNHRYLLDNSNTFGGTHFAYPRQVSVQLKYRFKY